MIERPSDYELARARAVAAVQGTQALVYCTEHGGEIGQIRTTPEGLFWANVPVEKGSGVAAWRKRLKEETGRRPSPAVYQVRVLIEMMAEAPDQPMAWCVPGQHRLILDHADFQSHTGTSYSGDRIRVKPV